MSKEKIDKANKRFPAALEEKDTKKITRKKSNSSKNPPSKVIRTVKKAG